jgi:hypothetical protein
MSAVKDAISAIRDALKLTDDVKKVGDAMKDVAQELREHDRRITRLEAKWETAMEFASLQADSRRQIDDKK